MRWKAKDHQKYDEWRAWFAWHPVKIESNWIWLETVQRTQIRPFAPVHPLYVAPWHYRIGISQVIKS